MFLNRDFCMEKLLAREVTIFPEKIKSSKILLKIHKTNTKLKKSLPGVQASKVKDFWIIFLAYAKALFKNIFGH